MNWDHRETELTEEKWGLNTPKSMSQCEDREQITCVETGLLRPSPTKTSVPFVSPWFKPSPLPPAPLLSPLTGVQLDDKLLVYDRSDFLATWDSGHFALELVLIDHKPIRDWLDLRQFKVASCQAT